MVEKGASGISVRAGGTGRSATVRRFVQKYATSAGGDLEYYFARRVPASSVLEGFTCAGERIYFRDDRLELSFIHERGDLIQLPTISIDNEKDSTGAVLLGDTWGNRRNDADQHAASSQHAP